MEGNPAGVIDLTQPLKQKFFFVFDFEFLEKIPIFFLEGVLPVMFFLMGNVLINLINLRMSVRKHTISLLLGVFAAAVLR